MSLHITDTTITSTRSRQTARRKTGNVWHVTWLTGRDLTQPQAVTAMLAADMLTDHPTPATFGRVGDRLAADWTRQLRLRSVAHLLSYLLAAGANTPA